MIIRKADIETDALAIMEGAKDFARRTEFPHLLPDKDEGWYAVLSRITSSPLVEIIVAEHNNTVVGGIGLLYNGWSWNPNIQVGEELFWWVDKTAPFKTAILLIDHAMKEIDEKGAIPIFKSLASSPAGVEKVYMKHGLKFIENAYMRI